MDKIFNFLKDRFSVMGSPMDVIFGMFSQAYVRLLKIIISHFFFQNIANVITYQMLKFAQNSTAFNKRTGHVDDVKLHVSNRNLQEPFRIALIKPVTFVVFEILRNLISMQNFLNANKC